MYCSLKHVSIAVLSACFSHGSPRLQWIGLRGCVRLSDKGLARVGAHCPELGSVDLEGCVGITDKGVVALTKRLRLRSLSLKGCTNVGDEGVTARV